MVSENERNISLIGDISGSRLDLWLTQQINDISRSYIQKLIEDGMIKVNGNIEKSSYKICINDSVEVSIPPAKKTTVEPENINLDIMYEDNDIIVINKPKNMVVHPAAGNYTGTLVNALMHHCRNSLSNINGILRPGIVHRIDKDTTGVLVVAKNNHAHQFLSQKLKDHSINRLYTALVSGTFSEERGRVDAPISRNPVDRKKMAVVSKGGRNAITDFTVIETYKNASLLEVKLKTGRTHQIRVHMSYIGHPVLGDATYGRKTVNDEYGIYTQALHARILGFNHPVSGEYLEFESPIPEYFNNLIEKLKKLM